MGLCASNFPPTPLFLAVQEHNHNEVERLATSYPDQLQQECTVTINSGGAHNVHRVPLMQAVANNDTKSVDLLLAAGADINQTNSLRCSALHTASYGPAGMVQHLLLAGARANVRDSNGLTPLEYAKRFNNRSDSADTVRFLKDGVHGVNSKPDHDHAPGPGAGSGSAATMNSYLTAEPALCTWDCKQVHEWVLSEPLLAPYAQVFIDEEIDGEVLTNLTKDEFRSLLPDGTSFGAASKAWHVVQNKQQASEAAVNAAVAYARAATGMDNQTQQQQQQQHSAAQEFGRSAAKEAGKQTGKQLFNALF
jgi:Ankyrin repeats (3 copies)/SAM domain (Sterile alpha motif)